MQLRVDVSQNVLRVFLLVLEALDAEPCPFVALAVLLNLVFKSGSAVTKVFQPLVLDLLFALVVSDLRDKFVDGLLARRKRLLLRDKVGFTKLEALIGTLFDRLSTKADK